MVIKRSASGYGEIVRRLIEAVENRGLTVFARIDHAAAAREAGLELADEQVVLFGNPRAGTPLMQSDPRIGVELPLRILVWADADGVLVGYVDGRDLDGTYDIGTEHQPILEQMATLLGELADEAAGAGSGGLPVVAPLISLGSFLVGAGGGVVLAGRMAERPLATWLAPSPSRLR